MSERSGTVRGECYCGRVRFEADLPPRFVAHCHCLNCTRAHGAGVVTFAGFDTDRLRLLAGEEHLTRFETEVASRRSFCSTCGTTLFFEGERWADQVHVTVANLLDPLGQAPDAHAYADRAPEWCPILDDLPQYGGENGNEAL